MESRKSATQEQIGKAREYNMLASRMYRSNSQIEASLKKDFEQSFDASVGLIWIDESPKPSQTQEIQAQPPSHRIEKQTRTIDGPGEKEKVATYAQLSDLAYVDLVTTTESSDPSKTVQKISKVHLDPLAFPNFKSIAEGKIPSKPTEDERILLSYLNTHKDDPIKQWSIQKHNDRAISSDILDLFRIASWPNGNDMSPAGRERYAQLDEQYRSSLIDTSNRDILRTQQSMTADQLHMVDAMEHVRTIKAQQASSTLETITGEGFKIVDYFPNETKQDAPSSGFGAICLKDKKGNLHFAIRWTQLSDWGDIIADMRLIMKHVPENQTQDMIAFFERNLSDLPENKKINITGHSLGGALTQIASVMYPERVHESYTFNAPWAKWLRIENEGKPEKIRQKFEKFGSFEYNGGTESVENRITNVRWTEGISLIANLGEDIGNYEVRLEKLKSHSITKLIEYVEKEATIEELQKRYVWPDKQKERGKKEKY